MRENFSQKLEGQGILENSRPGAGPWGEYGGEPNVGEESILSVKQLSVSFTPKKGSKKEIVKDISFSVKPGECLGILGESGSGKSMSIKAVLGLVPKQFKVEGEAVFQGHDLLRDGQEHLRQHRGKDIAMILQNPMTCFDPLYRMGSQMAETWSSHESISQEEILERSLKLLEKMQIREGRDLLEKYPHQLSGGLLQRIMIGLALSMRPALLVADEPTTAIDAITQYEIMKEFQKIHEQGDTGMIFITHDLGVISQIADRILVINQGQIVDEGSFSEIVQGAKDPYTIELIRSKKMVMEKYKRALQG